MTDQKKVVVNEGWKVIKKGYTVAPGEVGAGYTAPTGDLGSPPTTGTAVSKPTPEKKD